MRSQLANLLTSIRLLLAVVILASARDPLLAGWLHARAADSVLLWWMLVVALVTDYLDGLLARTLGAITAIGKQLDSAADTMLAAAAIICLAIHGWPTHWAVMVVVGTAAACWSGYQSQSWELWFVRTAVSAAALALYEFIIVGFACLAYGWHAYYLALMGSITVLVLGIYRARVFGGLIREATLGPHDPFALTAKARLGAFARKNATQIT